MRCVACPLGQIDRLELELHVAPCAPQRREGQDRYRSQLVDTDEQHRLRAIGLRLRKLGRNVSIRRDGQHLYARRARHRLERLADRTLSDRGASFLLLLIGTPARQRRNRRVAKLHARRTKRRRTRRACLSPSGCWSTRPALAAPPQAQRRITRRLMRTLPTFSKPSPAARPSQQQSHRPPWRRRARRPAPCLAARRRPAPPTAAAASFTRSTALRVAFRSSVTPTATVALPSFTATNTATPEPSDFFASSTRLCAGPSPAPPPPCR